MKIIIFSIIYNQSDILPWYLRHYSTFADEICVWDDFSTDGSRQILQACPKVVLRDWPYRTGIDEDTFLKHAYEWYPLAHPNYDWAIWVDIDEFIYEPNILSILKECLDKGYEVVKPDGYNMTSNGLPIDDGKSQLWELVQMGVRGPLYSKPIIFKPSIHIRWTRGKHELENCNPKVIQGTGIKLLHYRYLGYEYTKIRNAKNVARCGLISGDKSAAWTCGEDYKEEGGAYWAENKAKPLSFKVI